MNKVILLGRLTRGPEVRYTQTATGDTMAIARYNLAVDRRGKKVEGQPTADFISCVAFGKNGEFAEKYLKQGTKMAITGHITTGNYTNKDGQKVYTTDVVIDEQEFAESKSSSDRTEPRDNGFIPIPDDNGFIPIPDGIEQQLPFA